MTPDDAILPVVPMFHANAWGLVYAAPICGAKLVFPGPKLDGASIYELLDKEKVTLRPACRRCGSPCSTTAPRTSSRCRRSSAA